MYCPQCSPFIASVHTILVFTCNACKLVACLKINIINLVSNIKREREGGRDREMIFNCQLCLLLLNKIIGNRNSSNNLSINNNIRPRYYLNYDIRLYENSLQICLKFVPISSIQGQSIQAEFCDCNNIFHFIRIDKERLIRIRQPHKEKNRVGSGGGRKTTTT